jgi:hypothetical protein
MDPVTIALIAAGVGLGKTLYTQFTNQNTYEARSPLQMGTGFKGFAKKGANINKSFNQYNSKSHDKGGQTINQKGNIATTNPVLEIEKKENSYDFTNNKMKGTIDNNKGLVVFSDTLRNKGETYATKAAKINKKYKNADLNTIDKNGLTAELGRLADKNLRDKKLEELKTQKEEVGKAILGANSFNWLNFGETMASQAKGAFLPTSGIIAPPPPLPSNIKSLTDITKTIVYDDDFLLAGSLPAESKGMSFNNKVALGLKGLGLANSFANALSDYKRDPLFRTDFSKADEKMNQIDANLQQIKTNLDASLNANLKNKNNITQSASQRNAFEQAIYSNYNNNLVDVGLKEKELKNNINAQLASYEVQKAGDLNSALREQYTNTLQNKANRDYSRELFFNNISKVGTTLNNLEYNKDLANNKNQLAKETASNILKNQITAMGITMADSFESDFAAGKVTADNIRNYIKDMGSANNYDIAALQKFLIEQQKEKKG